MKRKGKRTNNSNSCNENGSNVNLNNPTKVSNAVISSSLQPQMPLQSPPPSTNVIASKFPYNANQDDKDNHKSTTKFIINDVNE